MMPSINLMLSIVGYQYKLAFIMIAGPPTTYPSIIVFYASSIRIRHRYSCYSDKVTYLSQAFSATTAPASVPASAFKSVHRSIADLQCCSCSSTCWLSQSSGIVPGTALVAVLTAQTIVKAPVVSAAGMVPFMDLPSATNAPIYVAMPFVYKRSRKLSRWLVFANWQKIVATTFRKSTGNLTKIFCKITGIRKLTEIVATENLCKLTEKIIKITGFCKMTSE